MMLPTNDNASAAADDDDDDVDALGAHAKFSSNDPRTIRRVL